MSRHHRDSMKGAKARRTAALARPELRTAEMFTPVREKFPDEGIACLVQMKDETGIYAPKNLWACRRQGRWVNFRTGTLLTPEIVGWYQLPKQPEKP